MRLNEIKYRWDEVVGYGAATLVLVGGVGLAAAKGFEKYDAMDVDNQEGLRHAFTVETTTGTSNTGCYADGNDDYQIQDVDTGEPVEGAIIQQVDGTNCFFTTEPMKPTGTPVYNAPIIR
ncbi:MAG: hypothetical protein R3D88_01345 [Alphaproteobacteria bacterium]|nr:hypothetical protein [Alphaproteobacteria bacterium]